MLMIDRASEPTAPGAENRSARPARALRVVPDAPSADAAGAAVRLLLEAEHRCTTSPGAHAHGARTTTSALGGLVREDPRTRQEFVAPARDRRAA